MSEPNAEMKKLLFGLAAQLKAAKHGGKSKLKHDFITLHGISYPTLHRWLAEYTDFDSGRKQRSDSGKTKLDEKTLLFIATSKNISVRNNDKWTKPTCVAMNIAEANNMPVNVGVSTVNRLLRSRKMDTQSQAHARNHTQMRTDYPNEVHQIDPSLCLIYYVGKRQMVMTEEQFYKNKPVAMEKVKLKVWRYVRYDHASSTVDVRYFEAAGENQQVLFDFLLWTWGKQSHRLSHGLPTYLLWDKGSANTSKAIINLLNALNIQHDTHAPHHPWVKGGVENGNRLVETHFESRLRDEPVDSVEALNASSENWVRDYNANAMKHIDSRILRPDGNKYVRDELWQKILAIPDKLIAMPDRKTCQFFLTGGESERQVNNNLISFVHPEIKASRNYDLSQWAAHYSNKDKVKVTPLLLKDGAVRVEIAQYAAEPLLVEVMPQAEFDAFGRSLTATKMYQEYKTAPQTVAGKAAKEIAKTAYNVDSVEDAEKLKAKNMRPFQQLNDGKGVVAHTHLGKEDLPQRLIPNAKPLVTEAIQNQKPVQLPRLTITKSAEWLYDRLGDDYKPAIVKDVEKRYPEGATELDLEQVVNDLKAGRAASGKAKLYAIG